MGVSIVDEENVGIEVYSQGRMDPSLQNDVYYKENGIDNLISRTVYTRLSNLSDMRNISDGTFSQDKIVNGKLEDEALYLQELQNEFADVMMKLNEYAETGENIDRIAELDAYLGSLGITEEYPFLDDIYGMGPWIEFQQTDPFRNVIHTDINGLVQNVVFTDKTGTTYNVVHDITK